MTLPRWARHLLGPPTSSPSADAIRVGEFAARAFEEGMDAASASLASVTALPPYLLHPDSQIGYRMTTATPAPTTKTLDLAAHFATFSSTYDHARRMGADRPLSHRFALADVLGEIEKLIEERVKTAVDAEQARASREAAAERLRRATEYASVRRRPSPYYVGPRFIVSGVFVLDRERGSRARFGYGQTAHRVAESLNRGTYSPASFAWTPGR